MPSCSPERGAARCRARLWSRHGRGSRRSSGVFPRLVFWQQLWQSAVMAARLLLVTSPLLHGPDVLAVQKRLEALGFDPGPLDGVYGPATERAVRAFQASAGLKADGVVGPKTRAALAKARPQPGPGPGSPLGRRALAEARRWVGTPEEPPGSNRTPFGDWFGLNGVPWCNIFLSYCFSVGAGCTIAEGFHG